MADRIQAGDPAAAETLITSHLRFVAVLARRYARFDLPVADLMQEGAVALTQAVQRFNPDRGVRLATYARAWIRSAMQDYAVRTWSMVRVGAGARQRRLFLALRRMASDLVEGADALGERLNRETIAQMARQFEVPAREVISIARRLAWPDSSLDRPVARDGNGEGNGDAGEETLADRLPDVRPTPEDAAIEASDARARRGALGEALAALTPRERLIVTRRHLADAAASFAAIGRELGLSKERVRTLEKAALKKLRAKLAPLVGQASGA
ncbi:MAG: sigma-70 family RNA polymerase sigma factor [Alphaproteobacteria bacterium]